MGLLIVAFFIFVAIAAPIISPRVSGDAGTTKIVGMSNDYKPHPPSQIAPLGTLSSQISIYHSLVWGTRSALLFGLTVVIFTTIIGVLIGTASAYFGGFLNNLLMRITDGFLAFPMIASIVLINQLFTILLSNAGVNHGAAIPSRIASYFMNPEGLPLWLVYLEEIDPVMIAFILFSWMPYARVMNTTVSRIMDADYVQTAKALGASNSRTIFRHLIPNAISPVIVMAARDVGGMVLLQATFAFTGLGANSPWGALLVDGRNWIFSPGGIFSYWWVFLPATLVIVLFGIGWNLMGDGLNDALNPHSI